MLYTYMYTVHVYLYFLLLTIPTGHTTVGENPLLDPVTVGQLESEGLRSPMLEDQRRDTLIASESSLLTDSIIRGT